MTRWKSGTNRRKTEASAAARPLPSCPTTCRPGRIRTRMSNTSSHGPADLRDADARVVAHRHLRHPVSLPRAAGHELDRPPVRQLPKAQGTQHFIPRSPEWAKIRHGNAIKPPDQARRQTVAEHRV